MVTNITSGSGGQESNNLLWFEERKRDEGAGEGAAEKKEGGE